MKFIIGLSLFILVISAGCKKSEEVVSTDNTDNAIASIRIDAITKQYFAIDTLYGAMNNGDTIEVAVNQPNSYLVVEPRNKADLKVTTTDSIKWITNDSRFLFHKTTHFNDIPLSSNEFRIDADSFATLTSGSQIIVKVNCQIGSFISKPKYIILSYNFVNKNYTTFELSNGMVYNNISIRQTGKGITLINAGTFGNLGLKFQNNRLSNNNYNSPGWYYLISDSINDLNTKTVRGNYSVYGTSEKGTWTIK